MEYSLKPYPRKTVDGNLRKTVNLGDKWPTCQQLRSSLNAHYRVNLEGTCAYRRARPPKRAWTKSGWTFASSAGLAAG